MKSPFKTKPNRKCTAYHSQQNSTSAEAQSFKNNNENENEKSVDKKTAEYAECAEIRDYNSKYHI